MARGWVSALGRISPNTSISGVRMTVAQSEAWPPTHGRKAAVATADETTWAMVTPIIAVDRSRSGCWNASMYPRAMREPCSARWRSRTRLAPNAISALEKKAEARRQQHEAEGGSRVTPRSRTGRRVRQRGPVRRRGRASGAAGRRTSTWRTRFLCMVSTVTWMPSASTVSRWGTRPNRSSTQPPTVSKCSSGMDSPVTALKSPIDIFAATRQTRSSTAWASRSSASNSSRISPTTCPGGPRG